MASRCWLPSALPSLLLACTAPVDERVPAALDPLEVLSAVGVVALASDYSHGCTAVGVDARVILTAKSCFPAGTTADQLVLLDPGIHEQRPVKIAWQFYQGELGETTDDLMALVLDAEDAPLPLPAAAGRLGSGFAGTAVTVHWLALAPDTRGRWLPAPSGPLSTRVGQLGRGSFQLAASPTGTVPPRGAIVLDAEKVVGVVSSDGRVTSVGALAPVVESARRFAEEHPVRPCHGGEPGRGPLGACCQRDPDCERRRRVLTPDRQSVVIDPTGPAEDLVCADPDGDGFGTCAHESSGTIGQRCTSMNHCAPDLRCLDPDCDGRFACAPRRSGALGACCQQNELDCGTGLGCKNPDCSGSTRCAPNNSGAAGECCWIYDAARLAPHLDARDPQADCASDLACVDDRDGDPDGQGWGTCDAAP